ncbi:hypothetical protein J6590_011015 [Homalodisca vitripennis]|nr:hypothetical protein J6590_011015 [Homalodisca vitripennis]
MVNEGRRETKEEINKSDKGVCLGGWGRGGHPAGVAQSCSDALLHSDGSNTEGRSGEYACDPHHRSCAGQRRVLTCWVATSVTHPFCGYSSDGHTY